MIQHVVLGKSALRKLDRLPKHIIHKLLVWVKTVEKEGLEKTRMIPGFHDEPLKGDRAGQRSIRLNRSYRAIYVVVKDRIQFVRIEEISKHEY